MSRLNIKQADGTWREILMMKGDKGDTGVSSDVIDDSLTDTEHTWSSEKINEIIESNKDADTLEGFHADDFTRLSTVAFDNKDLNIEPLDYNTWYIYTDTTANSPIQGSYGIICRTKIKNTDWIFDTAYSTGGARYTRININSSGWTPWENVMTSSNIANNLLTTQEGMVLDARQGKVLNDKIDVVNNNLTQNTNGQFVLPNGLKIQWGTVTITSVDASGSANGTTQTFTVPYTNVPMVSITSLDVQCYGYCGGVDKNVIIPSCKNVSANARPNVKLNWIAIGY